MSELSTQLAAALPQDTGAGPGWVKALRDAGAAHFRAHGLPTRKDEAWKYTGLGLLDQAGVQLATNIEIPDTDSSHPAALAEAEFLINMLDGKVLDQNGNLPAGLTVLPLADALNNEVSGLQALLESLPERQPKEGSTHGFTALNTATLDSGLLIHVAAGTDGGRLLINGSTTAGENPRLLNTRLCLLLEQDAKLELLEQFESRNSNTCNIVVQANLDTGASLQHIRFQQESEESVLITITEVSQQANS